MRYVIGLIVCVAIALTSAAIEPQSAAAHGDDVVESPAEPVAFPTIARNQKRGITTNALPPDVLIPPDPTAGSGIDACKSGTVYLDKRCKNDNNFYQCVTDHISAGRRCGLFSEGTTSQICKTCP